MTKISFIEGAILPIDKPLNWTSFDVVKKIRYEIINHFNIKKIKVGHAGTLDPLATGLIILGLIPKRSSLVMPGFLGTPAVMIITSEFLVSS